MHDIYLYEGTDVLKNLLGIKDRKLLEEAEADYVTYRLKEVALKPLQGHYDYTHLCRGTHFFIGVEVLDRQDRIILSDMEKETIKYSDF